MSSVFRRKQSDESKIAPFKYVELAPFKYVERLLDGIRTGQSFFLLYENLE